MVFSELRETELPSTPALATPPPAPLELTLDAGGVLWLKQGASEPKAVSAKPCFPWSGADRLIGLNGTDGAELAMVEDPERELGPESLRALRRALTAAHFALEIEGVESVVEDYELRRWTVRTQIGSRTFQTKLDEWPQLMPGGCYMIQDVSGDIYRVPPLATLDVSSQKLLWSYVD